MRGTRKGIWLLTAMVAIFMLALGAAAGASTDQDGPTPIELGDPVAAQNEIQYVWNDASNGVDTFTLSFGGSTTGPIAYNALPGIIETALNTLAPAPVPVIAVAVTGKGTTAEPWIVEFTTPAETDVPLMTATDTSASTSIAEMRKASSTAGTAPHGGYSSATNFCLQCHDVHDDTATGEYALMAEVSVTATCSTCHSRFGGGTAEPESGPGAGTLGTVSVRSAYDTSGATQAHGIGTLDVPSSDPADTITQSEWNYGTWKTAVPVLDSGTDAGAGTSSDSAAEYGLYCASCHTPHGDYGQMVNHWTTADETAQMQVWWTDPTDLTGKTVSQKYIHLNTSGDWELCTAANGGGTCAPAQERDAEGQLVSLYGYKLLSAYPNHTYSTEQSYNTLADNDDSGYWCSACHNLNDTRTHTSHDTGCSACHGNPVGDPDSKDFPHTSTVSMFLIDYPDALCITCHTPGTLP